MVEVLRVVAEAIRSGVEEAVEEGWHHPRAAVAEEAVPGEPRQRLGVEEEDSSLVEAGVCCCCWLPPWVGLVHRVELAEWLVYIPAFHRVLP